MQVPKRGDWVIFSSSRGPELGRVWNYDPETDADMVIDDRIGHHRFDDECPDYDPAACAGCREG